MKKKTFNVKLKDKTYELYYNYESVYHFDKYSGMKFYAEVNKIMRQEIDFVALTHIIHVGLIHNEDHPEVDDLVKVIPLNKLEPILTAVTNAVADGIGDEAEETEGNEKASQAK